MVRLKFLLFALLVLALWLGHLLLLSPALTARAVEQAGANARSAAQTIRGAVAERRAELAQLALSVAPTPALARIARAPAAERASLLAAAIREQSPESHRGALIIGAGSEAGGVFLRADGAEAQGDPSLLAAAGRAELVEVDGVAHAFITFPLAVATDGRANPVGALGLPLHTQESFNQVVGRTGLVSVALLQGARVVLSAGAQPERAAQAAASLAAGEAKVVERAGATRWLGLSLPLFAEGSMGEAPSLVGARDAVDGSPYEIVAVASTGGVSTALASYQQVALPAAAGLLLLSLIWLVWIGSGQRRAHAALAEPAAPLAPEHRPQLEQAQPLGAAPTQAAFATGSDSGEADATGELQGAPGYLAQQELDAPFADSRDVVQQTGEAPSQEDAFQFGGPTSTPAPALIDRGSPFGEAGPTVPGTHANPVFAQEQDATRAYPAGYADPSPGAEYEDNPDATRVASIPQELIAASSRTAAELGQEQPTRPASMVIPQMAAATAPATGEEAHFQEVFQEFVATRERCGEAAEGLTYDKFVGKLRKNREQLVQKYNCRTVRFQVYVKDGKAALKATPVRS